jgi:hypothetical protein
VLVLPFAVRSPDSAHVSGSSSSSLLTQPENFIVTRDEAATIAKWSRKFDILVNSLTLPMPLHLPLALSLTQPFTQQICTAFHDNLPIESLFFKLLRPEGTLVLCGLPETALPQMFGQALVVRPLAPSPLSRLQTDPTRRYRERVSRSLDPSLAVRTRSRRCWTSLSRRGSRPGFRFAR